MDKEQFLEVYRHSLSHILAKAVIEIYGKEVQYGIGPQIADGCYYDFVLPVAITEGDFKTIENKMREIIKRREAWRVEERRGEYKRFPRSRLWRSSRIRDSRQSSFRTFLRMK